MKGLNQTKVLCGSKEIAQVAKARPCGGSAGLEGWRLAPAVRAAGGSTGYSHSLVWQPRTLAAHGAARICAQRHGPRPESCTQRCIENAGFGGDDALHSADAWVLRMLGVLKSRAVSHDKQLVVGAGKAACREMVQNALR